MIPSIGDRFGKITVTGNYLSINGRKWPCQCDCGSPEFLASITRLNHWSKSRTGCRSCMKRTKHGHGTTKDPTYGSWYSMKNRCYKPTANNYRWYGAKGVTVCQRWLESFSNFLDDMGQRPLGKTLDRIDPNGNYEPSNCRWATPLEQRHNQRKPS